MTNLTWYSASKKKTRKEPLKIKVFCTFDLNVFHYIHLLQLVQALLPKKNVDFWQMWSACSKIVVECFFKNRSSLRVFRVAGNSSLLGAV